MARKYEIRETMGECADAWNSQNEPISPFLAAAQFGAELDRRRLRYDTYVQTVITGGGHVHDPLLTKESAIQRNVANALQVAEMLDEEGIVDLNSSAEAAAMPIIKGWSAEDWMTFWPLIMGKPDLRSPDRLRYLEQEFKYKKRERVDLYGLNMDKYRNRTIPKSERLLHYATHANALYETLKSNKVELSPVWRTIGLLGIEESVGATTEKSFAQSLGVRAFQAVLANVEPLDPDQLADQDLARDITRLRELGVHALAGAPSQKFILVEDREYVTLMQDMPEYS